MAHSNAWADAVGPSMPRTVAPGQPGALSAQMRAALYPPPPPADPEKLARQVASLAADVGELAAAVAAIEARTGGEA